ncbi:unnamed protein product, partial [marine sediment metagenome]
MNFILGGLPVPLYAAANFQQDYETFGGFSDVRLAGGGVVRQTNWQKIRTSLSGDGWIPDGLSDLDYSSYMTLSSGAPRSKAAPSNVITITADRRTDAGYT